MALLTHSSYQLLQHRLQDMLITTARRPHWMGKSQVASWVMSISSSPGVTPSLFGHFRSNVSSNRAHHEQCLLFAGCSGQTSCLKLFSKGICQIPVPTICHLCESSFLLPPCSVCSLLVINCHFIPFCLCYFVCESTIYYLDVWYLASLHTVFLNFFFLLF